MTETESTLLIGAPEASSPVDCGEERKFMQQVERILRSEELRGSEVLRRLLRFLAEKSLSGEADELKEYILAIDGLGKPASYDPRHNSAVRLQVSRLRQKLADYYRSEGQNDPVLIDVPKGRFKLQFEQREGVATAGAPVAILQEQAISENESPLPGSAGNRWSRFRFPAAAAAGFLLALAIGAVYNLARPAGANATAVRYTPSWNQDMEDLWRPFIATSRPTIVAIEDPLFVELNGKRGMYYRDKELNSWQELTASPALEAIRSALKNRAIAPSRYYTAFGEVDASFLIARLLGSRVQNLAVMKTSTLSMRELADNNVVFVGIENIFFGEQIQAAPITPVLQPVPNGIRDVHPAPNEPAVFLDQYSTAPTEEGTAYALVTHVPGPLGGNDVESFTSSRAAGYVAAVTAFTNPQFVHALVRELRRAAGGQMPRYYQVLLKVKFTAEEPTEITYVLARQLRYPPHS